MRPFLKWAGNKYSLLSHIKPLLPQKANRLIEPFAGSGAVFLNTNYPDYLLADTNPDLIHLFQYIQTEGDPFIEFCAEFFIPQNNHPLRFYMLRKKFNTTNDTRLRSALFLYLNRHTYNGLCRYNSQAKFNVPFGRYEKPYFPRTEMKFFHQKSENIIFKTADFIPIMQTAQRGDVIYCDPPYVPLSSTASFAHYHQKTFGWEQQCELAHQAKTAASRGVTVLISNHCTPEIKKLYHDAVLKIFPVRRTISCTTASRKKPVKEVLAVFSNA
ncbi:MAG: Dam family site-specific DNA-(adenine-N6)-methyltransferase [Gammaproteobacteria bacterium]